MSKRNSVADAVEEILMYVFAAAVVAAFAFVLGMVHEKSNWKEHAIENNYGEYNKATGEFQFTLPTETEEEEDDGGQG